MERLFYCNDVYANILIASKNNCGVLFSSWDMETQINTEHWEENKAPQ